jgi:D-alanyl-D-alanine carboxypeptidase
VRNRLLALCLPLLLVLACTSQPAPATPTPTATDSPSATPTLSPSPTASPSSPPTATPTGTPTATPSPTATPTLDTAALEAELARILDKQRLRYDIPGLSAAVIMPDGTRWSAGSGFAWVEREREAQTDTPFVVGSISKTFVTALVMQLVEEGVLDLDDELAEWLPDYPAPDGVTLRQLLSHTSGIYNYFEHPDYNRRVFGEPDHVWTPQEIVTEFAAPPYFEPGTGYHYSNTGFVLLGMVAEAATGNSLAVELRTRFFDPLGLADTFFQGEGPPPNRAAQGYLVGPNGRRLVNDGTDYRPTTSAATVAWAAGAVVASAADLATWARTLYGGELLEPDSLAQMTDFDANPYAGGTYGLGTRTRFVGSHSEIGHTGSLRGFAAAMWHMPAEGITVVVLSNRGRVDVNPIADLLAMAALEAAGYGP